MGSTPVTARHGVGRMSRWRRAVALLGVCLVVLVGLLLAYDIRARRASNVDDVDGVVGNRLHCFKDALDVVDSPFLPVDIAGLRAMTPLPPKSYLDPRGGPLEYLALGRRRDSFGGHAAADSALAMTSPTTSPVFVLYGDGYVVRLADPNGIPASLWKQHQQALVQLNACAEPLGDPDGRLEVKDYGYVDGNGLMLGVYRFTPTQAADNTGRVVAMGPQGAERLQHVLAALAEAQAALSEKDGAAPGTVTRKYITRLRMSLTGKVSALEIGNQTPDIPEFRCLRYQLHWLFVQLHFLPEDRWGVPFDPRLGGLHNVTPPPDHGQLKF